MQVKKISLSSNATKNNWWIRCGWRRVFKYIFMSKKWLVVLKNGSSYIVSLPFKTKFYRARHKHYWQHKGEWIPRQTGLWLTWRGQRNMSHYIKGTVLIIMGFKQRLAFCGNIFAQIFKQTVKTFSNINLVLSRHSKREKSSLPVACVAGAWK